MAIGALAAAVIAVFGAVYLFSDSGDYRLQFNRGELYFNESVTEDEARRVGASLVQQQFFSEGDESTVQLQKEKGKYLLRFVIKPEYAEDPLVVIQYGIIGNQVATDMLGEKPLELGFIDGNFKLIRTVPLSALMMFGKGELYYSEPVTATEAHAIGELIRESGFFNNDNSSSAHVCQEDGTYQLKFVINPSIINDTETKSVLIKLCRGIAAEALGSRPVVLHLCDENLRTHRSEYL
jgi:hypothetical protein